MPSDKTTPKKQRLEPYSTDNRPKKCREETCKNTSQPPSSTNALRKTGRCNDCALKYGIAVISDLLVTDAVDDSKELLFLSARIASKVVLSDLSKDGRRRLVSLFHNIARQIEAETYVSTSPFGAFFGTNTTREARKGDENV